MIDLRRPTACALAWEYGVLSVERRGAMPLVLDDLFVHFDDERTDAGLRVLEQVSEQTQVLLFTHHRSVGEQALAAIAADRVHVLHLAPMTT